MQKFVDSSPDELELIIKPVPHVETALELLIDGHADICLLFLANGGIIIETGIFSSALVLPRREPTRVLVGEDKPEYIPKNGIIVADCEVLKRQMLRLRNDLQVKLPSDFESAIEDVFEKGRVA